MRYLIPVVAESDTACTRLNLTAELVQAAFVRRSPGAAAAPARLALEWRHFLGLQAHRDELLRDLERDGIPEAELLELRARWAKRPA